ncbi:MAG: RIP metalloprotease [Clostridia bacterium]|nr:RIP metalloprotease [Clostridia bacterium]
MNAFRLLNGLLFSWSGFFRSLGGILLAIVILLAMVTIHEFGHYVAGKLLGFKINEFSVGFGPALFKKRSKKTGELFALRVIPLGGYCAFDGEDEYEDETSEENPDGDPFEEMHPSDSAEETSAEQANEPTVSETNGEAAGEAPAEETAEKQETEYPEPKGEKFNDQPPWKRIIVLIAGATMNFLLALVLLFVMVGVYGVPKCMVLPTDYHSEMQVPHAEWATETLEARDVLLKIDGKKIGMATDCIDALKGKKAGEELKCTVLRYKGEAGWQEKTVSLTLKADANFESMSEIEAMEESLGFAVYTTTLRRGFGETVGGVFSYAFDMSGAVLRSLGELLTGKLGLDSMGGPVTTISTIAKATNGFSFLYLASFIGVNLAVFNLLPIPALDGCKVIFCIIEWIRKKPINRKVETIIHFVGIIVLFVFAILVDLLQIFR